MIICVITRTLNYKWTHSMTTSPSTQPKIANMLGEKARGETVWICRERQGEGKRASLRETDRQTHLDF